MQSCEVRPAAWRDPVEVLSAFAEEPFALALLSGGDGPDARWSYLARAPDDVLVLSSDDPRDPFDALAGFAGTPAEAHPDGPPFQGGVAGLAAYELGARAEPVALSRRPGWPDLVCARYPALLAFDHRDRRVLAVGRGEGPQAARTAADRALGWLDETEGARPADGPICATFDSHDGPAYERAVARVVADIAAGVLFQANIARTWRGATRARPFDLLARLARSSPAPFAGYLRLTDRAVVSNSPERFVRLTRDGDGFVAQTRPIKGTAARGGDAVEDAALADALSRSVKDRAENLMIVDLMRNDLARVCQAGAVEVAELFRVETFANVHHLVSTVTGRLQSGKGAADLLRAAFPPGSVTGAPKVQAMKTIAQLEAPRGPYCGCLFWLGADGAFDSSVLIRTAVFEEDAHGWRVEARAGAGIVADSEPFAERLETEAKISAIARALT